jgi:hypothetical protein
VSLSLVAPLNFGVEVAAYIFAFELSCRKSTSGAESIATACALHQAALVAKFGSSAWWYGGQITTVQFAEDSNTLWGEAVDCVIPKAWTLPGDGKFRLAYLGFFGLQVIVTDQPEHRL